MKTALKSRKRKRSAGKLAPARRDKIAAAVAGKRQVSASGIAAIPVKTKSAQAPKRGGTIVLQHLDDHRARPTTVFAIDATSATFGDDLRYAFEKNVAKARRENKRKFGSPDPQVFKGRES